MNLADIVIKSPYSNALSTEMFCEINHIESCMLAIAPGVEVPVTLPYELYEISFSDAHFRDLQKLPFSIVLTSYPDIREISLSNITYKAGTSSKSAQNNRKQRKKDTPEGSILTWIRSAFMRKWDIGSKSLRIPQMLNAIKNINGKVCMIRS